MASMANFILSGGVLYLEISFSSLVVINDIDFSVFSNMGTILLISF